MNITAIWLRTVLMCIVMMPVAALSAAGLTSAAADTGNETQTRNILILNSYHRGFDWTDSQNAGAVESLEQSPDTTLIYVEYMDWKRYPTRENVDHFHTLIRQKYKNIPIDAVITTDDRALEFAIQYRGELLNDAPIIFSGVNRIGAERLRDETGITGVIEEIDPSGTVLTAKAINPSLSKVYVLFDRSESGISTGSLVEDAVSSLNLGLQVIPLDRMTKEEILAMAAALPDDSIILMTTYYSDSTGRIVDFGRMAEDLAAVSSVPVYHTYDFGMQHDGFGGSLISGEQQGSAAAGMALRVLAGEEPAGIPLSLEGTSRDIYDYVQLQRYGVDVKDLPPGSQILNRPFSFYESYRTLVWGLTATFAGLLAFIGLLLFYIKQIRRMRAKLAESNERFSLAAYGSDAVIWDYDMTAMVYYFSESWYKLLGYERDEINERYGGWRYILHPEDADEEERRRREHLSGQTAYYYCEYRMKSKEGRYIWFQTRGKALRDSEGGYIRFAGSMVDITERKEYESKLQVSYQELESTYEEVTALQDELLEQYHKLVENQALLQRSEEKYRLLAYNDALSGLPNRLSLSEELNEFTASTKRRHAALFFLDLDNFKYVNDTLGHTLGDQLLIEAGERLLEIGESDARHYRFGGDEFVILLETDGSEEAAITYAESLSLTFREPFLLNESMVHVAASIGIALYPDHGTTAEELLKYADIAMYKAKEMGKGTFVMYGMEMRQHFDERMIIEKHLRDAMDGGEFSLNYQPIMHADGATLWGFEALIRWNSPVLGFVPPPAFIKIAEDRRLIGPIGEWVLRNACTFIRSLQQKKGRPFRISVNISVIQLMLDDFVDTVLGVLAETGLEARYLELEITESIFMESLDSIGEKLEALKQAGIGIALDDFGTGYSSLSYLKRLPITTLKIDKSFIDGVLEAEGDRMLAKSIISIGQEMGLGVTAEGVETKEQLDYLKQAQCDKIQGYYISRPLPQGDVDGWVDTMLPV